MFKVLFNVGTSGRKVIFVENLKNLKRQGFDPRPILPDNTRVPTKVAQMIDAGDTLPAGRLAASRSIKDILKSVRSPVQPGDMDLPNNNRDGVQ